MNLMMAIIAGAVGLLVTGSAIAMAWLTLQKLQEQRKATSSQCDGLQGVFRPLLQWTWFDYLLIGVFAIGSLFLLADVLAVIRDASSYPLYHYGYLICGFGFMVFGMLFMVLRLSLVLTLIRFHAVPLMPNQDDQPNKTE